jgi:hypothetical protein
MKKVYVAMAAAMLFAGGAAAQTKIGIEAGVNFNQLADHYQGETTSNQIKTGFHGGLVADFGITNHFSVSPGLRYIMKGGQEERNYNLGSTAVEEKNKLSYHYIELPVNVVYKFGAEGAGRFMVGVGPYVAAMVNAQNKFKTTTQTIVNGESIEVVDGGNRELEIGDSEDDEIKRLDYGAQGFIGYEMPMGAFVKGGASMGLANTIPGGSSTFMQKNYNFSLTLGYFFGGNKNKE